MKLASASIPSRGATPMRSFLREFAGARPQQSVRPPRPGKRSFAARWGAVELLLCTAIAGPAQAIPTCELDRQAVNPDNGATMAGKSGLKRCCDADTGADLRERELRDGTLMGVVRHFEDGQVDREFSVDERSNRSVLSLEQGVEPGGRRVPVREETSRIGHAAGVARTWYPGGQLRRIAFHGDDGREQAAVEFNTDGRLRELRSATRPVIGAGFDDKTTCGHTGGVSTVVLFDAGGHAATRVAYFGPS